MTRFERKILVAILLVALGPLVGSLWLWRTAVRDAWEASINPEFEQALQRGVEARKAQLFALRTGSERAADAIAAEVERVWSASGRDGLGPALTKLLGRYPDVSAVEVRFGEQTVASSKRDVLLTAELRTSVREREAVLGGQPAQVLVTVTAPEEAFQLLEEAGEVADVYSRLSQLQEENQWVARVYVWVYASVVSVIIIVALVIGVILSRRVTQRVAALARATKRVGAGDLTVTVPTGAADEVTELTQAFNEMVRDLRDSRARIEYLQRIGAWQDFARRLAHEIKNPLTPIQLAAQEMDQTYDGDSEAYRQKLQHARAIIEEEVATLRRLVGEFSSFAKLPEADLIGSDLREFVLSLEDSVPAILGDVGRGEPAAVQVSIECATKPMPVRIDPMMLKRCLDNLIRNAVQAIHRSDGNRGTDGKVIVAAFPEGGDAVIEVRDNGPGVPQENWDRIFDPYYTTRSEGTGLGLAIVKKVVLEHGGEVTLNAAPEGGARFRIELPMRKRRG